MQALLDDHVVKAQAMRASPFIKPLEAATLAWEQLLLDAQVCVHVCACMMS
jgi:dynein heavy chain